MSRLVLTGVPTLTRRLALPLLAAVAGLQGVSGQQTPPTFRDGLATDCVTDAVLKSAKTRQWETVPAANVKVA